MLKVERLIVGHTLSSYCLDGVVLDPVSLPPYPLRTFRAFGKEYPLIPMVVEECPEGAECVKLDTVEVLKEGDPLNKACKGIECQEPWPLKWMRFKEAMLIKKVSVDKEKKLISATIRELRLIEKVVVLRGGRKIGFEELVWTSPYPKLLKLLGEGELPKSLEATIILAKTDLSEGIWYHFSPANPILVAVKPPNLNLTWLLGPGTFDPISALKHFKKKGYVNDFTLLTHVIVDYYALDRSKTKRFDNVVLLGRTAEWRERGLPELLKCNV